jgi:predicted metal-dependent hydrolase
MRAESTQYHYDDGLNRFDYTVHLKPRLRHRYIRIRNGEAIVTAVTSTPHHIIEAFIADKAAWITQHLHRHALAHRYDLTRPDALLYWRGERCTIVIQSGSQDHLHIENRQATFVLTHPPLHETMLDLVHRFRKQNAPTILLPKVSHWSHIMGLHPTRITFRRARTRWGSCSSRNSLSLNIHLLMLPDDLIDYVIVHELAHIRHKNHSKAFWSLVGRFAPNWKENRKAIRTFESYLI